MVKNNSMKNLLFISVLFLSAISYAAINQDFPDKPDAWVNDYANLLNEEEEYSLNKKLADYEDSTSTQIFIVTMDGREDIPIELMGAELGDKWKVGQKGSDNGIIILVYPAAKQVTIQTGYGLEQYVPDAIAKRIIENEIKPNFRNNNYFAGLDDATNVLFSLLSGQYTADEYKKQSGENAGSGIAGLVIMLIVFFIFFGRGRSNRHSGIGKNIPFWIAMSMLSGSRNTHSGSFGNFKSGSGGFRGGGFGGFGGGGGGSFGGGGASGSW